jgi:hypothetical protein
VDAAGRRARAPQERGIPQPEPLGLHRRQRRRIAKPSFC